MRVNIEDWRAIADAIERLIAVEVYAQTFTVNRHVVTLGWDDSVPYVVAIYTPGNEHNYDD